MDPALAALDFTKAGAILADTVVSLSRCWRLAVRSGEGQ